MSWVSLRIFLGFPKWIKGKCGLCKKEGKMMDLGDGDLVCDTCWNNYTPSYKDPKE